MAVTGDAKALVLTDFYDDGLPDYVTTRNNGAMAAWRNHHDDGKMAWTRDRQSYLRVDLEGPSGNPTAIGARLLLNSKNGNRQLREVTAGGGCFSQSSPRSFFSWPLDDSGERLIVRWPDGTETSLEVPDRATQLRVKR